MLAITAGGVVVWAVWIVAGFACLASGLAVVSFTNPFYSALALIGNLGSLAVLYLLLSAEFVAAAQVLVYAGAVMVMFLFVTAYVGPRHEPPWASGPSWKTLAAVLAAGAIFVEIIVVIGLQAGGRLVVEPRGRLRLRLAELDRAAVPHRPSARVRDHVDRAARRGGRRRHPRLAHAPCGARRDGLMLLGPGVVWYLGISAFLFGTGAFGVLVRRNPLIVLLSLEIMLNGANLALIAFSRHAGNGAGQIFALSVMAVAAAEVCVGLGLVVAIHRRKIALDVDALSELRG